MGDAGRGPLRVIVAGAAGRMGKRLIQLIAEAPDLVLAGAIEHAGHGALGRDAGEEAGVGALKVPLSSDLEAIAGQGEVLLEFSVPAATLEHLRIAVRAKLAAVLGTTGYDEAQQRELTELARQTRCLVAPNMSVGVNVLFSIVERLTRLLGPGFDLEVLEMHHRMKKDAPSGTAVRLGEILAAATGRSYRDVAVCGRQGMVGARSEAEIGLMALRGGDVAGDHTVYFIGQGERLEITHRAHSRDTFAHGALRAVRWLVQQPVGLYSMKDVLGL